MTTGIIIKMMYKQGEIVLVPFPFNDNLQVTKQRPAVIISKDSINKRSYIVAKITSVTNKSAFGIPLYEKDTDIKMDKASEMITNEIMTVSDRIIIRKIGSLKSHSLETLLNVVKDNFEIE
jgi:mRNA interferase MazF